MSNVKARPREAFVARILKSVGAPKARFHPPQFVACIGLPGAGKSTLCRRVAAETGVAVLESDALRRMLFGVPTFERDESRALFAALHAAARRLLGQHAAVVLDATNLRASDLIPIREVAFETGAALTLLHVWAPEHVIIERLGSRNGAGHNQDDNSTAGLAVYRRLAETADPVPREAIDIDTSDAGAMQSLVDHLIERLNAAKVTRQGAALATSLGAMEGSHS